MARNRMDLTARENPALPSPAGRRRAPADPPRPGPAAPALPRVRVDGKFFRRGRERLRVQGVTYGPFAPDAQGQPFPPAGRVRDDFARMQAAGINAVRTYHLPPAWLLHLADEHGPFVFVDVPWRKHLCFLESTDAQREARQAVRDAARHGRGHPCVLAYSVGNEIPPDVVRWHGARRVERFLAELADVARQADPDGLVTYASYPPTEYLELAPFDFATFNVYLHDREAFRRYLFRLQHLVGDKPLLLGELGMDTLRHGETAQAEFLAGHVRAARLCGLAGQFIFAWTDDWFTGGHRIEDWAFGVTHADRAPKAAYHALREVFEAPPADLLPEAPRVSVVVCTYNGGRTLEQCLRSLAVLDYPGYEVIVVDDGSTDNTREVLERLQIGDCRLQTENQSAISNLQSAMKVVHQANRGLSAARNVGLQLATGEIVAYTDSDCFADPDWLTHLVAQLTHSGAAAVGGPNLTPEDGGLAACVAASPGQPTHVLEGDQVAEHIPGCNMAFRRDALLAINGFDPQYRKAGDDVDVCWRLQHAGYWITFAPGAFVWHHRRQGPRSYLRQQAGYGEAEALLRFKHPDKFNGRGDGKWRGVLYGTSLRGLRLSEAIIYRGAFGTGLFQCLYQPAPAHWAMLPCTLEWHLAAALGALAALFWPPAWAVVGAMLALSVVVAAVQAVQAHLAREHDGFRARLLVAALCYAQPLVRSWSRYRTRLFAYRLPAAAPAPGGRGPGGLPLTGARTLAYWSANGCPRTALLRQVVAYLNEHRWGKALDSGWSDWDLEVYCHPWTVVQVCTAQEDHGGGGHLIRVRYRLRLSGATKALAAVGLLAAVVGLGLLAWPSPLQAGLVLAVGAGIAGFCLGAWWRGTRRASQAVRVVDALAERMGLLRCPDWAGQAPPSGPSTRSGLAG
jgi:O-antigen biosynthesis protein